MKNNILSRITRRGWIWIGILYIGAVLFYWEFFSFLIAVGLGAFMSVVLVSMLLVGYLRLGTKLKFPLWEFILYLVLFTVFRMLYIYFFLSKHLPEYTLFHYPNRALPATAFGSASLLFLGYSYAVYEWGLAAREKYRSVQRENKSSFIQPVVIKSNGASVYLLPQDILYISANGEYVDYHTSEKKYTVFKRLKTVEKELFSHGFKRCHRSYIINVRHVKELSKNMILIVGDLQIPISKTYREQIEEALDERNNL
ncbi:MAG: LytTR family DNA-binding domain-containing protein [Bacteroidota bacterium]